MLNHKRCGKITCFTLRKAEKGKSKISGSQLKRCSNIFFTRCGLSSTYHLVPLALLQYDTKPTRQYDSIMLIHDSLDTGVFQYHPSTILTDFTSPQTLASPLLPLPGMGYWELIPFPFRGLKILLYSQILDRTLWLNGCN
jgi:hypothetical protein